MTSTVSSAVAEEIAAMTTAANSLASVPVVYLDDHVPDPEEVELPRKMTAFPVPLPEPPKVATKGDTSASAGALTLNIKSLKPPISFTLANVSPADTVLDIKERLASEHSRAPTADIQRLLLKGKVLADNKLLKEYVSSNEGEVALSLMLKPGSTWTAEEKTPAVSVSVSPSPATPNPSRPHLETGALSGLSGGSHTSGRGHSRTPSEGGAADQYPVPSLMLSTPGSPTSEIDRPPVPLDIADPSAEIAALSRPGSPSSAVSASGASAILTHPEFWVHLRDFLSGEVRSLHSSIGFGSSVASDERMEADADDLFETFLLASKGSLEATDIARIRDAVNITGMAGT